MVRGSCLCGEVRFGYARDANVVGVGMCHCSQCRKVSGTGSNAVVVVPATAFEWLSGRALRRRFARPSGWRTTFCGECGSPLLQTLPGTEAYWVPAGLLGDAPDLRIAGHIHVASKAPWDEIPGDAPRFEGAPPSPRGAPRR